jgi:predicted phage gp36 major capsid-like protein
MPESPEESIARHERWLAEHEAMIRRFDEDMVELQALHKAHVQEVKDEMKLTWASFRSANELIKKIAREGDKRMDRIALDAEKRSKALDEKLDRLTELMIGNYGGNGRRRKA